MPLQHSACWRQSRKRRGRKLTTAAPPSVGRSRVCPSLLRADYAATTHVLLPATPPDVALPALTAALAQPNADILLPLFADLATASWPLTPEQWVQVPSACPGLGAVLPAVHARSEAEAGELVAHLPRHERRRLRTAALARRSGVWLPGPLVGRILALSAAP